MTTAGAVAIVALTLWAEARGEGVPGLQAVADCIWTRAEGKPSALQPVCLRRAQFSCWNGAAGERLHSAKRCGAAWEECIAIARKMCEGRHKPGMRVTHYHRTGTAPHWASKMKRVTAVGAHVFYFDPNFREPGNTPRKKQKNVLTSAGKHPII